MIEPEPRRRRFGLRTRTSLAFAALAFGLSVTLAVMTYTLTRRYLLDRRETQATQQAVGNAFAVAKFLRDPAVDRTTILANIAGDGASRSILQIDGEWFATSIDVGRDAVPSAMQEIADRNTRRQRIVVDGEPVVLVAVPIGPDVGVYYEAFPLAELRATLHTLAIVLAVAAAITTLVGAIVGWFASKRVLRPIETMADDAVHIADGDLSARLHVDDADLAPFVHSFNDMVDALQERIDREARFASDASHELRTPLTAIRSAIDVLDRRVDDNARPALDILRRQTFRFENLVLDLLEISRFNAGSTGPTLESVDPSTFVKDVLRRNGHPDVAVVVEPSAPAAADLDRLRIERVLTNLIENADHYAGGATLVTIAGTHDALEIAVDDEGPGVDPSERDLVFERFHRGEASRASTAPGTGLGLAIAAQHVRLHGGRITVRDSPAGGARFLIELPLHPT